jgi:hypothetical protein
MANPYADLNVKVVNPIPLDVGDIEIGAVELKDATTDTRAVVKSDGTNNALVVVQNRKTITIVSGTKSSSGDNTLIAAPGVGVSIVLVRVTLQNESSTATTMLLQNGASGSTLERILAQNQGDGLRAEYALDARPKLSANTALNLNLSGANSCGYTVHYFTE